MSSAPSGFYEQTLEGEEEGEGGGWVGGWVERNIIRGRGEGE